MMLMGTAACGAVVVTTCIHSLWPWRQPKPDEVMHRLLDHLERADTRAREASEARMTRLEQAIEAIAVEVERIAEGQRFVTKLLAERAPDRHLLDASRPERVITPH